MAGCHPWDVRDQLGVVLTVARDPTLARMLLAFLGFNMAEFATWVAIIVYAYGLGGASMAAIVAMIQLIPAGLIAPFAGAAGDRFRLDRVLVSGYLLQAGSLGAAMVALYADAPVTITVAFATLAAMSITITRPVQSAILPTITHSPADLTAANAAAGLAENLGVFLGPLIGGLLLFRSEPGDVFAVFALVSLGGALLVARLPAPFEPPRRELANGVRAILGQAFGGFDLIRRDRQTILLVLVLAASMVVYGALDILYVAVAIDLIDAGESWAGFLNSAFGLGGVLGALAAVTLVGRRRMTPALVLGAVLVGIPIATLGLIPTVITAPLLLGVTGIGMSLTGVAGRTLLQRVAPEHLLARAFGLLEGLTMFAFAAGSIAVGALIAAFGIGWALAVGGLFLPAMVVLAWTRLAAVDRDARPIDTEALGLLRRIPIFAPLSAPSMERILVELTRVELSSSAVVVREGEIGDRFYIIAKGRVEVTQGGRHLGDEGPGDFFGEIALLRDVPRTATVTALTPVQLIAIERTGFLEAVTGHTISRGEADAVAEARLAHDSAPPA